MINYIGSSGNLRPHVTAPMAIKKSDPRYNEFNKIVDKIINNVKQHRQKHDKILCGRWYDEADKSSQVSARLTA